MITLTEVALHAATLVPTKIEKKCPPPSFDDAPENLIGTLWGYVETIAPMIAIAAFIALGVVWIIPKLRKDVLGVVWAPLLITALIGSFISLVNNVAGSGCP